MRVCVEYKRLNRQEGFNRTVLQCLTKANKWYLCFQWKHGYTQSMQSTQTYDNVKLSYDWKLVF